MNDSSSRSADDGETRSVADSTEAAEILGQAVQLETQPVVSPHEAKPDLARKVKTLLIGKPRDFSDRKVFTHISLIAFLAWVGLGADGLSSSCYGPYEAFKNLLVERVDPVTHQVIIDAKTGRPALDDHTYLAVFLALATIGTVLIISRCYSHIIEEFPSGGGGYLVATKLLGKYPGVISGSALLVDYVLTITVSIAAAGDALFSLMPENWYHYKLVTEVVAILMLILMNLRGVKESVMILMPIFILFLITHILLIGGAVGLNLTELHHVADRVQTGVTTSMRNPNIGLFGMLGMFLYAYSFGAGTYTGIEAVSNSMPVMREPRVATGKKTMVYMAVSLALMAGGLILAYMLLNMSQLFKDGVVSENKTLNYYLTKGLMSEIGLGIENSWSGWSFMQLVLLSEATLLFVAAQAGFIDGPRILANMAHDSWVPHWFGHLSERLATHNGVLLIGLSALGALLYTGGATITLITMYSINVFVTFSLSMIGMLRHWWQQRGKNPIWLKRALLFGVGAIICLLILAMNVYMKAGQGGWITLVATGTLVLACIASNRYYKHVFLRMQRLNETLGQISTSQPPIEADPDRNAPTAAILVGSYGGLGIHTLLNAIRFAPGHFKNVVFLSAAVIDSGNFKGADAVDDLRRHTEENLERYVDLSRRLGMPAASYMAMGTDAVEELEHLCITISKDFPKVVFFAGQLVFRKDVWFRRLMHNQTAYSLLRRLQWDAIPMVILPTRVR